jgi:nicotinate-nucleotide adenylyltransferase
LEIAPPVPSVPGSVGVLGGTFDPIHVGHLALGEEAREALGLERVLFVPAAVPPHKQGRSITAAEHRRAMVELAIGDNPAFALSMIELERSGPSYTVDTLASLGAEAAELTLLLSAESFAELPDWHEPRRIVELARLAVAPRAGYELQGRGWFEDRFPGVGDRLKFLDGPNLRLSASEIRARVAAGRSVRYLVPVGVARYIVDHDLYRADPARATDQPDPGIMEETVTRTSAP